MNQRYFYNPVGVSSITRELEKAYAEMNLSGEKYTHAANINTIMSVPSGYGEDDVEDLIYTLSLTQPTRFFLVVMDEGASELRAEFAARCHAVSKNEHICSEAIRLTACPEKIGALCGAIRANLITGMPTQLYIYDKTGIQTFSYLAPLAEQIIFSSQVFEDNFSFASQLTAKNYNLIDLEWLRQSAWRDQIRSVFDRPLWRNFLPEIEAVEIESESPGAEVPAASSLIMAGWICDRLNLQAVSGSAGSFSCLAPGGRKILLNLGSSASKEASQLNSLLLRFGKDGANLVQLRRSGEAGRELAAELLETTVRLGEEFRLSRTLDDESRDALLRRYFFIGESTVNYRASLEKAMKLGKFYNNR